MTIKQFHLYGHPPIMYAFTSPVVSEGGGVGFICSMYSAWHVISVAIVMYNDLAVSQH